MKLLYIIIILFSLPDNLFSQEFQIGHTLLSLIDEERKNRIIPVEVYYPADSAGDNVPVKVSGTSKFPVLCFGHGYLMSWNSYSYMIEALVSMGYIMAFPKTEGELLPSHRDLALDISFILREITEYGNDSRSIFFNRIKNMNCAMGHSMGGGSAILAASYDSNITAVAVLSPADTRPSAVKAAAHVNIPSLIISGEDDCVTKPMSHQIPIFNSLKSSSKILLTIRGASHCQMADKSFPCNLAEFTCGPGPTITRSEQQRIIFRYLVPWLNLHLKGDSASAERVRSLIDSDTCVIVKYGSASIF